MSTALAIATVTETLFHLLTDALPASLVSGAQVTVLRPDATSGLPTAGANVFLYQVTPNLSMRNADLPTRSADGSLRRRPQIALDLYYLVSFYGADAAFEQQRLLGAVARALHATPILARAAVKATEGQLDAPSGKRIFDSHLSEQLDVVRVTPINFSLEEMSKLWSVFLKTDYVLSLAYVASVVLIETDDPPPSGALPVLAPRVLAVPFSLAVIDAVEPQAVELSPGTINITLRGTALNVDNVAAFITPGKTDPIFGTILPGSVSDRLVVTLPPGLRPGVNTVQLTQSAPVASPPDQSPHVLSQSNAIAFIVLPTVANIVPASQPGHLASDVTPPVGPRQQVSLVLNQITGSPPDSPQAFVLPADPHDVETTTFVFNTTFPGGAVPHGTYLARVRVDAAESRLAVNASGAFTGPQITI